MGWGSRHRGLPDFVHGVCSRDVAVVICFCSRDVAVVICFSVSEAVQIQQQQS